MTYAYACLYISSQFFLHLSAFPGEVFSFSNAHFTQRKGKEGISYNIQLVARSSVIVYKKSATLTIKAWMMGRGSNIAMYKSGGSGLGSGLRITRDSKCIGRRRETHKSIRREGPKDLHFQSSNEWKVGTTAKLELSKRRRKKIARRRGILPKEINEAGHRAARVGSRGERTKVQCKKSKLPWMGAETSNESPFVTGKIE
ncbi:hypothetical protein DFH11DRAFT_1014567 [Phellopilus nigrolimitatus]|nr:hypothetical protein DFH11DRAFT_1014567 [Phellopilus nigrolimitatus]